MREDLNDLLIFAAVARAASLTRAAAALGLPKSTVSRRLQALEERVGGRLLVRTTRRIELTELGEGFREQCERVEREVLEARSLIEGVGAKPRGTLRITMPADFAIHYMAEVMAEYVRRYPEVRVDMHCSADRVDLVAERFDVALRFGALEDSSIVSRKFVALPRALYASPRYLREAGTPRTPDDLAAHRFVLLEAQSRPHPQLALSGPGGAASTLPIGGPIVTNSMGTLRHLAIAGAGIAVVPRRMCDDAERTGALVRILDDWRPRPMEGYYMIPARRLVPAKTRALLDLLTATFDPTGKRI